MALPKTQKVVLFDKVSDTWETIKYQDYPTPQIESDQDVIIKNKYAGINFIESYFRKGIYPTASFPSVFGREASGTVAAVGDKVTKFKVGDKVAYLSGKTFAQYTKIDSSHPQVIRLPQTISDENLKKFGAILIQGLTARTFVDEAFKVEKDQFVLVWAAAGGVGQILIQLAHARGAHVIAIASTDEKLQIAKSLGAEYLIKGSDDIVAKVEEVTGGKGVDVSFDSVGKDTFETSLAAIKRKGTFISYGNSSGAVPPFPITRLSAKNIKIARPTLFNYIATEEEFEHYSKDLLELIESGKLVFDITKTYPLEEYSQATQELEARKTTGKLVLEIPQ